MSERKGVEVVGWAPQDGEPVDLTWGEFYLDGDGDLMMVTHEGAVVVAGDDPGVCVGGPSSNRRRVRVRIEVLGFDNEDPK